MRLRTLLASALIPLLCVSVGGAGAQEREGRLRRPVQGAFDVEVIVKGWPLEKLYGRGRTYVEAVEGAEYELRIRNPLPVRVAVALSVDGLNTVDARRTSSWEATKWVIEPYGTLRLSGWQVSKDRARRFYFTTERDSYAVKLGRVSDLGVITAVIYRETVASNVYTRPIPHERDGEEGKRGAKDSPGSAQMERRAESAHGKSGSEVVTGNRAEPAEDYAATGIGRPISHRVERVRMDLEREPVFQTTIRYEYRPALVKLGIIPRATPLDDPLKRRERARGFENQGFCPEP